MCRRTEALPAALGDFGSQADFGLQAARGQRHVGYGQAGGFGHTQTTGETKPEDKHVALRMAAGGLGDAKKVAKLGGEKYGGSLGHVGGLRNAVGTGVRYEHMTLGSPANSTTAYSRREARILGNTERYETQAVDVKTPRHPKMRGA